MREADNDNDFEEEYFLGMNDNHNVDTTNAPMDKSEDVVVEDASE